MKPHTYCHDRALWPCPFPAAEGEGADGGRPGIRDKRLVPSPRQEDSVCRPLRIPIDGTDLLVEVVGNAPWLVRALGARVDLFHVMADAEASLESGVEILRASLSGR